MRDIRDDLKERLNSIERERQVFQRGLGILDDREKVVRSLLKVEERVWSKQQVSLPGLEANGEQQRRQAATPLGEFLMESLADGQHRTLKMLEMMALDKGWDFGDKSAGRVIHFALVGMQVNQMVKRANGMWRKDS